MHKLCDKDKYCEQDVDKITMRTQFATLPPVGPSSPNGRTVGKGEYADSKISHFGQLSKISIEENMWPQNRASKKSPVPS